MVAAIIIASVIAGMSPYLVYRLSRQDKALHSIQVTVNGRLTRIEAELARMTNIAAQSAITGTPVEVTELAMPVPEVDT